MRNTQPIEKRELLANGWLAVHSIFYTIQGEGPFCGTPAVFVRLAGCNLQCPACDTDYTSKRMLMTEYEIFLEVNKLFGQGLVVITGGEPFRQPIGSLIHLLMQEGCYVQVESNGTLEPPPVIWSLNPQMKKGAYLVCSPKTGKVHPEVLVQACALKYVVRRGQIDPEDGLPITTLDHTVNGRVARPPEGWNRPIYVQPIDVGDVVSNDIHTAAAVDSCMNHGYTLQLQIHKLIGVE